jgi:hypothetical protein
VFAGSEERIFKQTANSDTRGLVAHINTSSNFSVVSTGTNVRMVVQGTGNVGIGTISPVTKLHVEGNTLLNGLANVGSNQNRAALTVYHPTPMPFSGTVTFSNVYGVKLHTGTSRVHWVLSQNVNDGLSVFKWDALSNAYFPTTGFVMGSNGFMGIGASNPSYMLDVNHPTSADAVIRVGTSTLGGGRLMLGNSSHGIARGASIGGANDGNDVTVYTTSGSVTLATNSTEGLRVNSSANVGIGTSSPSQKLHVVGNTILNGGNQLVVNNGQNGGTGRGIYMWGLTDTSWGIYMGESGTSRSLSGGTACTGGSFINYGVRFRVNVGTTSGFIFENSGEVCLASIRSDGLAFFSSNVGIGTSSPLYRLHVVGDIFATGDIIGFSDKRLKSNITIIDDALAKIHKINGYTYNLPNDEKKHTGLIAQEVLEILPEAVYQEKKEDGTEGHYSLAYGNMAGLLVEAIKEIDNKYKSQIEDLQQQITLLKDEINVLKNN